MLTATKRPLAGCARVSECFQLGVFKFLNVSWMCDLLVGIRHQRFTLRKGTSQLERFNLTRFFGKAPKHLKRGKSENEKLAKKSEKSPRNRFIQ